MKNSLNQPANVTELFPAHNDGPLATDSLTSSQDTSSTRTAPIRLPVASATPRSENSTEGKAMAAKVTELQNFIQSTCDWTWEADANLKILAVSAGAGKLYGIDDDFFRGKSHSELAGVNAANTDWSDFTNRVNSGQQFRDFEFTLHLNDNHYPVRCSGFPLLNAQGIVTGYQGTIIDVSDIQNYRNAVDLANKRFVQAIDSFSGSFALFDDKDRIVAFNETYRKLHWFLGDELKPGLAFERCIRIQIEKGIIKPEPGQVEQWIADRVERFHNPAGPFEVKKANNQWLRVTEQRFPDGGCLKTMEDISEMKAVELELRSGEQRFRDFAEAAADWFFEFSPACKLTYLSNSFESLTGHAADDYLGKHHEEGFGGLFPSQWQEEFYRAIEQRCECHDLEIGFTTGDGEVRYFSISGRPAFDAENNYVGFRGIAKNISETRKLTDQLNRQASIDDLTQLPNRREFNRALEQVYFDCSRNYATAVVAFLDLDEFKIVNDSEGHVAGDRLLQELAETLRSNIVDGDIVARLGGDEFGLILTGCGIDEGVKRIELMLTALRHYSFHIEDRLYNVSASVGVVQLDQDSPGIDELMRQVDIACYEAKDMGRNQIQIYNCSLRGSASGAESTIDASAIEQALATDRFVLYAQPIAAAGNQSVQHHEILVRMLGEDGAVIPPIAFIGVAERYRLMTDVDRWVIAHAFETISRLNKLGNRSMYTINLSGRTLTDATLIGFITEQLQHFDIAPETICFEITETALVANFDQAAHLVNCLRSRGCRFALDDFGSGLSSFAYLKNFTVDYLKIDGSLVRDIVSSDSDRKMVAAIAGLASTMGMLSIAEFVEDEASGSLLHEMGVDYLQGYGIGKPAPLADQLAIGNAASRYTH